MTEAASNALLFEQEIDERVVMALMRVLTDRSDQYGFATNLVYAFLQRPELQRLVEERCASYVHNMQSYWMHEGAKQYAGSMTAQQPRYGSTAKDGTRW
jgi:hypothetical protein